MKDINTSAAALFDGGWRAEDRDQLIAEFDLTEDEAETLCRELAAMDFSPEDYEVSGFGISEYGIEYGYEIDAYGNRRLCVTDANDRIYDVCSEHEAERICREFIDETSTVWYAVMTDREDNDFGYGSHDKDCAMRMLAKQESPDAYIAVVDTYDSTVLYEIEREHE